MSMQAQRGGRDTAPNHLQPWHQKGVGGKNHALATSPQKDLVLPVQEAQWAVQRVWTGMEYRTPTRI